MLDAANELGFRPNQLARGLVTSRTSMVAAIVHDISDPYFAEVVRALGDVARDRGYQLLASSSDRDPERELEWLQVLLSYRVDGVIFASSIMENGGYEAELRRLVERFRAEGRSVVRFAPHLMDIPGAVVDQEEAAADMIRFLLGLGHRRVGLIAGPQGLRAATERSDGYRRALEDGGIGFDPDLVAQGAFTSASGAVAVNELLQRAPDVTAVFSTNDVMAFGALRPLTAAGIRVPRDLSLAGFNDVKLCRYVSPSLTSVHVPIREQAERVFSLLLDGLEGHPQASEVLQTYVVERESTSRPRDREVLSPRALARLRAATSDLDDPGGDD